MSQQITYKEEFDGTNAPHTRITLYVLPEDSGLRLDKFLGTRLPFKNRASFKDRIKAGQVSVAGTPRKASYKLKEGEKVELLVPPRENWLHPETVPLDLLEESTCYLAYNKDPGVVLHPAGKYQSGTLLQGAQHWFQNQYGDAPGEGASPLVVHRLDQFTSGLVIFGKGSNFAGHLGQQFENRQVQKVYVALVDGTDLPDEGFWDAPMGQDPKSPVWMKQAVRPDGKSAQTFYKVVHRLAKHLVLMLFPFTGRNHQLRVHAAHFGFPIVGDPLYNPEDLNFSAWIPEGQENPHPAGTRQGPGLTRQALHAYGLKINDPQTEHEKTLRAPLKEDMNTLLAELGAPPLEPILEKTSWPTKEKPSS